VPVAEAPTPKLVTPKVQPKAQAPGGTALPMARIQLLLDSLHSNKHGQFSTVAGFVQAQGDYKKIMQLWPKMTTAERLKIVDLACHPRSQKLTDQWNALARAVPSSQVRKQQNQVLDDMAKVDAFRKSARALPSFPQVGVLRKQVAQSAPAPAPAEVKRTKPTLAGAAALEKQARREAQDKSAAQKILDGLKAAPLLSGQAPADLLRQAIEEQKRLGNHRVAFWLETLAGPMSSFRPGGQNPIAGSSGAGASGAGAKEPSVSTILAQLLKLHPKLNLTEANRGEVLAQATRIAALYEQPLTELNVLQAIWDVMEPISAQDAQIKQALQSIDQHMDVVETLQKLGESYAQFAQRPTKAADGKDALVGDSSWEDQLELARQLMQYEIDRPARTRVEVYFKDPDFDAMNEAIKLGLDPASLYFDVVTRLLQQNPNDPARVTNEMITLAVIEALKAAKLTKPAQNANTPLPDSNSLPDSSLDLERLADLSVLPPAGETTNILRLDTYGGMNLLARQGHTQNVGEMVVLGPVSVLLSDSGANFLEKFLKHNGPANSNDFQLIIVAPDGQVRRRLVIAGFHQFGSSGQNIVNVDDPQKYEPLTTRQDLKNALSGLQPYDAVIVKAGGHYDPANPMADLPNRAENQALRALISAQDFSQINQQQWGQLEAEAMRLSPQFGIRTLHSSYLAYLTDNFSPAQTITRINQMAGSNSGLLGSYLQSLQEGLTSADLSGVNLSGVNLQGIDLSYANLSGANLRGADLHGVELFKANLSGADLSTTNLTDADLWGANLTRAILTEATLVNTNLLNANLSDANFTDANLQHAWLKGGTVDDGSQPIFTRARIDNVNFSYSQIQREWFHDAIGTPLE